MAQSDLLIWTNIAFWRKKINKFTFKKKKLFTFLGNR